MKKAIIFDVYGTLISTGNGSVTAAGEILKKINVDMDAKVFYKKWKEFHKQQMNEMTEFVTEEVVFIGDSLSEDVKEPQSVGIYSVLLDRKGKYAEEEKNVADAVITDLTGLY